MKKIITVLLSVLMVLTLAVPVFAADRDLAVILSELLQSFNDSELVYDATEGFYVEATGDVTKLLDELGVDGFVFRGTEFVSTSNNLREKITVSDNKSKILIVPDDNSYYGMIENGETIQLFAGGNSIKGFTASTYDFPTANITYQFVLGDPQSENNKLLGSVTEKNIPVGKFNQGSYPSKGKCSNVTGVSCLLAENPYVTYTNRYSYTSALNGTFDCSGDVSSIRFEYYVPNEDATVTFYFEEAEDIKAGADYNTSDGLVISFPENADLYKSLIGKIYVDYNYNTISENYNEISLSLADSDYRAQGNIVNGEFNYGSGSLVNEYIKPNSENTSVKVSVDSLNELGIVNGKYNVSLIKYGKYLYSDSYYIGQVTISGLANDIDTSEDRVDELNVVLDDSFKTPTVGETIPSEVKAQISGTRNGSPVEVEGVRLYWAKKSPLSPSGDDWYIDATHEPYYDSEGNIDYRQTPLFDANSEYYLSVQYFPNYKKSDDLNFKLSVNGKLQSVNGEYIGRGAGGGLSYFYVDFTDDYCTIIPYGYAKAKNTVPADITTAEQTELDTKMVNMFTSSSSAISSTEQLSYVNDNNKADDASASSNIQTVVGAGGKIEIGLRESTAQKVTSTGGSTSVVVTSMSFDVTPTTATGETKHGNVGTTVTFRLPVDKDADFTYANVTHEGSFLQQCEVKTAADGSKYIEVSSNQFSVFGYTLTNTRYVAPSGGSGSGSSGSTITRKPVVNTSAK